MQNTTSMKPSINETLDMTLEPAFTIAQRIATPFLRLSLGIILLWIGALKFADPTPVVGLLHASLPFLAAKSFVYGLGVLEVVAAAFLLTNHAVRYVALFAVLLFAGTLTIFLVAPMVSYGSQGFPHLTLAGQFLLKDLVLAAGCVMLVARDLARDQQQA